jgi:hypothetical protein
MFYSPPLAAGMVSVFLPDVDSNDELLVCAAHFTVAFQERREGKLPVPGARVCKVRFQKNE